MNTSKSLEHQVAQKSPIIKAIQSQFSTCLPDALKQPLHLSQVKTHPLNCDKRVLLFPKLLASKRCVLSASPNSAKRDNVAKKRVAVLFSGGPAPGGHNIISGLFDALKQINPENELLGVLNGPKGLLEARFIPIFEKDSFFCTGGFDLLGTDRTKLSSQAQFEQVKQIVETNAIDGLVIVGGDDSNTNAAFLAEYLYDICVVVGCPKTIDGDLQYGALAPISFGFDTATKVYAELVSNIMNDAASTQKYWHFVKLMGRNASHVSLEVALKTKANITLITEEIIKNKLDLSALVARLAKAIKTREEAGFKYGVMLIPEGVVDALQLSEEALEPLLGEGYAYDSHGNLNVSAIDSAKLLADALHEHMPIGNSIKTHFFGYEGRCATPSLFDNVYTYASGRLAASLIVDNHTGYLAAIAGFNETLSFNAVPLEVMLHQEKRQNSDVWVIKKALVELDSPAYKQFLANQESALLQEVPLKVSPRQFFGPTAMDLPLSLMLNQGYDTDKMRCIDEQYNKSNNT